jgi:uncharacterized protein YjbI with pentapeptide repeats
MREEFRNENFNGQDFSGETLTHLYERVTFIGADLRGAELIGTFIECDFTDALIQDIDVTEAMFSECTPKGIFDKLK